MAKLQRLAAFMTSKFGTKFEGDAAEDDKKVMEAAKSCMEGEAAEAMGAEMYDYEGAAGKFEEMARLYEDAHPEPDGDEEAPHHAMRRMASKFRRMAQPTADDGAGEAKMAAMSASLKVTMDRLAKLEAEDQARKAEERKVEEAKFERLADEAVAGGYPKESRAALVKFARSDFDAARASVMHLLPKTGAPAHLFTRLANSNGGPASPGAPTSARVSSPALGPKKIKSMGMNFVEADADYAEEIKRLASSEDAAEKAKIDKLIPAPRRGVMFDRLLAAERVVRAERPDLAEQAD